jgi:hypothetical protein
VIKASQGENLFGAYAGQITYTPFRGPNDELENEIGNKLQALQKGELEIVLPEKK